jgi:hypothetical protein
MGTRLPAVGNARFNKVESYYKLFPVETENMENQGRNPFSGGLTQLT